VPRDQNTEGVRLIGFGLLIDAVTTVEINITYSGIMIVNRELLRMCKDMAI
jgi:hypothetical protein